MTVREIEIQIQQFRNQVDEIGNSFTLFRESEQETFCEEIQNLINFKFNKVDVQLSTYQYSTNCVRFFLKDENRMNEIFSLRYESEDDEIHLSYYSSGTTNSFELNRLILLGKVSELLLNQDRELKELFKTSIQRIKTRRDQHLETTGYNELLQKIKELNTLKNELLEVEFINQLKSGYETTRTLHLNSSKYIQPKKIQLVRMTNTKYELEVQLPNGHVEKVMVKKENLNNIYLQFLSNQN